jgi:transglutaminase-like putative cysteine protease
MIAEVLARVLAGLIRRLGVTTLLSMILLGLAMGNIANGLADMIHNLDTGPFWLVIAGGVFFGWLLAKSPLPGWLAVPAAVVFGAGVLFIQVGRLGTKLLSFMKVYLNLSVEVWRATKAVPHVWNTIDTSPLAQAFQPLVDGYNVLFLRARLWVEAITTGRGAFDPIAAALVWGGVLWIITVWAAWFVRRSDRVFLGIFPAAGLYAFTLYYTGMSTSVQALVVMLGSILLLYALRSYAVNERGWQEADLDRVDSPWELGTAVVSITAVLMLAAALAPSLSVRQMVKMFDTLTPQRVGNSPGVAESLGLQSRPEPTKPFDQAQKSSLPNQKLIGPGAKLSKQPVMRVAVAGYDPFPHEAIGSAHPKIPPRYYWRSFIYDQYNGRGWYTSPVNVVDYSADITATLVLDQNHQLVRQKVSPMVDLGGFIYAAGELLSVDAPYQVAWRMQGDALAAQSAAQSYTAVSSVPFVTETELRSAGTNYPEWVSQPYMQLPEEVPDRVRSLAYDLTAVQPTPYDQALAIEAYLRTISYTLDVPAPPLGRDVADYFLFDLRRGYCDYFATAMVVLARSVGIPARLVTGYASGGYDIFRAQFVVLAEDAHSWVEVYFPSYGWVEFEPTSGRPAIDHTGQGLGLPPTYNQASGPEAATQTEGPGHRRIDVIFWAFVVLLIASASWLTWWVVQSWRVRRMTPEALVAYVYRRLYRQGLRFRLRSQPGETAGEFSERLRLRVASILLPDRTLKASIRSHREHLVGLIARDLHRLTLLYEKSLFSAESLGLKDKAAALETWKSLRGNLRRAGWRGLRYLLPNFAPPER